MFFLKNYTTLCVFVGLFFCRNISAFWYDSSDICNNLIYIDYCLICYNTNNVMYFLSQIPYYDRCDYIRIGHQRNVTKGEILKQEDEFMEKQSDVAKKRYKEYKDEHNFSKKLGRERLDSKVKHLSSDAQDLYKKIYAVVDNNDVTPFQEFQLCHTIINEAKFKAVVEASALLPSKFYPETYNGHFIFYENENPDECDDC